MMAAIQTGTIIHLRKKPPPEAMEKYADWDSMDRFSEPGGRNEGKMGPCRRTVGCETLEIHQRG